MNLDHKTCTIAAKSPWGRLMRVVIAATLLTPAVAYEVKPITDGQAAEYKLDQEFYQKGTVVQDILIATSNRVSDHTHREAAYQFDMVMKNINPEIAQRIRDRKVLCILVAHDELTSDVPQFKSDKTGRELDFYNWRQRGFLTRLDGRSTVFFAEEDVMEYEGGMQIESILIHEFGHVIHGAGFDEDLQRRLTETFKQAKAKGLWNDGRAAQRFRRVKGDEPVSLLDALVKAFPDESPELIRRCLDGGDIQVNGEASNSAVMVTGNDKVRIVFGGEKECYAGKNRAEYFAEGVQSWYDTNRTMDHDHNRIHTREQLKAYDPGLAKLCEEVLGTNEWRFVSPRARAGKDHLKGYEPAKAPVVVDADFIQIAALDYYDEYWSEYWQRLRDRYPNCVGTTRGIIDISKPERPADAIQLVGPTGHDLIPETETPCKWVFEDGILTASPQWDSVLTKDTYRDFRMHVEFNVNEVKDAKDPEKNGNSGVYIQQRYELQILNSYGVSEGDYKNSYCGSLYRLQEPDRLVNRKAGEWQSFDIVFRAARFDGDNKIENARITVYQNQQLIHDDFAILRKTGAGKKEGPEPGPIKLQGHHNPVRFRNVWIQKLAL